MKKTDTLRHSLIHESVVEAIDLSELACATFKRSGVCADCYYFRSRFGEPYCERQNRFIEERSVTNVKSCFEV